MKKKRSHGIPDFSTKRGGATPKGVPAPNATPAPHTPRVTIKPQATSSKSGRRGT